MQRRRSSSFAWTLRSAKHFVNTAAERAVRTGDFEIRERRIVLEHLCQYLAALVAKTVAYMHAPKTHKSGRLCASDAIHVNRADSAFDGQDGSKLRSIVWIHRQRVKALQPRASRDAGFLCHRNSLYRGNLLERLSSVSVSLTLRLSASAAQPSTPAQFPAHASKKCADSHTLLVRTGARGMCGHGASMPAHTPARPRLRRTVLRLRLSAMIRQHSLPSSFPAAAGTGAPLQHAQSLRVNHACKLRATPARPASSPEKLNRHT
eukprot:6211378-Pleurochrysis_carterae.AAC.3